ncbi:hypothetical protein BCAH1134_C0397 (plasmid) [Bacillus cereus AH1134]|nr:hypothetical protein BCAH1134_C0397 [Bacillus cereus AH1134]
MAFIFKYISFNSLTLLSLKNLNKLVFSLHSPTPINFLYCPSC